VIEMADNNQSKQAVALCYDEKQNNAPKVVAKGSGFISEQILDAAEQHAVPVYQNKTITGMLMAVEIDREVPPELYKVVAEILAYVYRIDKKMEKHSF
jgi:flagellar biosynthesis protein